jgi:GNAT superfamily N-acetyltransferase
VGSVAHAGASVPGMIAYQTDLSNVGVGDLAGFFVDWPAKPSPERHLALLHGSDYVVLARDEEQDRIVGFVTAIADGAVSAFIPLLEVLPEYHGRGIGTELVRRMLALLEPYYMVDLRCDPELVPFYRRFGMQRLEGMGLRNRDALAEPGDS